MPAIEIPKYHSQWDGDNGGVDGACGETCLKMIDNYLTGREVPISAIIANGDNNPEITTISGMIKAAKWLGFDLKYYYDANKNDIFNWLKEGRLLVPVIKYSLFPNIYKQDRKYVFGHFILITAMTDDKKAIRFADPNFWGARRSEGWMNNNKWAGWTHFEKAFNHGDGNISRNGAILVAEPKQVTPPAPPTDPCGDVKIERDSLKTQVSALEDRLKREKQGRVDDKKKHDNKLKRQLDLFDEKVNDINTKHRAEIAGLNDSHESEIKTKDDTIEALLTVKADLVRDLNEQTELAEGRARVISSLKETMVKDQDVATLFNLLLYKLWLQVKGVDE